MRMGADQPPISSFTQEALLSEYFLPPLDKSMNRPRQELEHKIAEILGKTSSVCCVLYSLAAMGEEKREAGGIIKRAS